MGIVSYFGKPRCRRPFPKQLHGVSQESGLGGLAEEKSLTTKVSISPLDKGGSFKSLQFTVTSPARKSESQDIHHKPFHAMMLSIYVAMLCYAMICHCASSSPCYITISSAQGFLLARSLIHPFLHKMHAFLHHLNPSMINSSRNKTHRPPAMTSR
jgi:hypothetical protein